MVLDTPSWVNRHPDDYFCGIGGDVILLKGDKYHGRPCKHCGGTLRYVKQYQCVPCSLAKWTEFNQTPKGQVSRKKSDRRRSDKELYGAVIDNDKVARRRAAEDLIAMRELGV